MSMTNVKIQPAKTDTCQHAVQTNYMSNTLKYKSYKSRPIEQTLCDGVTKCIHLLTFCRGRRRDTLRLIHICFRMHKVWMTLKVIEVTIKCTTQSHEIMQSTTSNYNVCLGFRWIARNTQQHTPLHLHYAKGPFNHIS